MCFLYLTPQWGRAKILKLLLEKGADAGIGYEKNGLFPIHIAAKRNHLEAVQALLE